MGYNIDLEKISIDEYKTILRLASLIPSWMVLKEDIDENLESLKGNGIQNLDELKQTLKDKIKLQELSKRRGLSEDYLNVLRRVINGYHRKPNKIKDFPETPKAVVAKLEKVGIKNTLHLFERINTAENRSQLSEETKINEKEILRLTKLTDLSRIRWVNHTFAYVLYEAGYDMAVKIVNADYQELYETVKKLNTERKIYKAHIGLNDMKMLVEAAKLIPLDIQYP